MDIIITHHPILTPELRTRWLELWQISQDAHPFNHPAWFNAAPMDDRLAERRILFVSKAGQDILVCAFTESRRCFSLLESPYLEKSAMVVGTDVTPSDWAGIVRHLLSRYDRVLLQEVPQPFSEGLASMALPGWRVSVPSSISPYFHVDQPALSAKRRHEFRRYTRKLYKEHGPIDFELLRLQPEHLADMTGIERRSSKPKRGRSAFDHPEYQQFMRQVIEHFDGMCWIGMMRLQGRCVAHYAAVTADNRMVGLHMAFDQTLYRYSPGGVLIYNLLPMCEQMGIDIFDFGRGVSVLKTKFCGDKAELRNFEYFFRKNIRGTVAWFRTKMLWSGISAGRRLRAWDHRRLNLILDRFSIKR